jgi:hypothetical protein
MTLTDGLRELYRNTAETLKRGARRVFMARVVQELGRGGQRQAERELGWNRTTIRKGQQELRTGVEVPDGRQNNGPKTLEERLPTLLQDLDDIVAQHCQADPTLRTTRVYRRVTSAKVRELLAQDKGYSQEQLPSEESIRRRLNEMGYRPRRVRKTIPKKNSPRPTPSSNASTR